MENVVCKTCGGSVTRHGNNYVCDFCRNTWVADVSNDVHAVERANAWEALRSNDFEKATELFENIIQKDQNDHEAFWGRALARNGIVYVTDYNENKKVPTCNNISEESFLTNKDVQKAISLTPDAAVKASYQKQAEQIEKIRVEWLSKASKEPPYDVFISFKDSDRERGIERTQDSVDVQDIYTALVAKGYNVFFSRVTLRDKVSEQYEPYIYNAIKTAKVMIVFGEKAEYFNAVWVKNEWSRFKARIATGEKHKNSLITVYKNVDPYEIPASLTGGRQAIDYGIPSNYEVLMNHIKRVIDASKPAVHLDRIEIKGGQMAKRSSKIATETLQTRELGEGATAKTSISEKQTLDLAKSYLNYGQWEDASVLCDDLLLNKPDFAEAVWYKLQAKFKAESEKDLLGKMDDFGKKDYAALASVLNYAEKDFAGNVLNVLYDGCKTVSERTALTVLNMILPYNYANRPEKIEHALTNAIKSDRFDVFKLLLSTLDEKSVDAYIKYNLSFAAATKNGNDKMKCVNNVLSVEESNETALFYKFIDCVENCNQSDAITTLESILKYAQPERHKTLACDALRTAIERGLSQCMCGDERDEKRCLLFREALKYYPGKLIEIKDILSEAVDVLIGKGCFGQAEYLLSLIMSMDENDPGVYWRLCLVKTRSRTESDIVKSDILLKQVPEYTKYLTMVDEKRRRVCIKRSLEQIENYNARLAEEERTRKKKEEEERLANEAAERARKKAKRQKIAAIITAAVALIGIIVGICVNAANHKDLVARGYCEMRAAADGSWCVDGIDKNNRNRTEIVIPETYKGKPVTYICSYAFGGCSSLTSVTIPNSVTSIGHKVFKGCSSLTSVTMGNGVTYIGENAFRDCSSLTSVTIPNSVKRIGIGLFDECRSLTSITIGNGVASIESYAFNKCYSLRKVYYKGTIDRWNAISKDYYNNSCLTSATMYYYSESAPTESGHYWHYDASGNIVEW